MNNIKVGVLRRVSVQIEASHYTPRRRLGGEEALGGVSGQSHAPAALYPPGKGPPVPTVQEAGSAAEPV
jgi:hypothetical protein